MNQNEDSAGVDEYRVAVAPGFLRHPMHFLALGFGSGCVPRAPGTAGTLVGAVIYLPIQALEAVPGAMIVCALFAAGVWICERTATDLEVHDHPAIVWDEIVGYLVTMIGAPRGIEWMLLGFMLFRLFDIWKPWPVRWVDGAVPGGLGIMLDDVAAGFMALISLQFIAYLLQG